MSDVIFTVTVFHTLAAVSVFGFMVYSAVRLVSQRDKG